MATYPVFSVGEVLTADDMNAVGLWLVKTQTIGNAVSSQAVTSAFDSTYDNYLVMISGGVGSTNIELRIQLGSTVTNYKYQLIYGQFNNTVSAEGSTTAANVPYCGYGTTAGLAMNAVVLNPNRATRTTVQATYVQPGGGFGGQVTGILDNTTQYTDFTVVVASGTMTGGTIRVYGYRN